MLPRPKLFIVFVAWAAACGLLFVVWQDPPALPAHQQHLSPPAATRARKERTRAHVSNPLYLRIKGSDATEKFPTYRRDGITAMPSSSPLPPRRHQNHRRPAKTRGPRPIPRPQALRAWRNRHRHTQARGESEPRVYKTRGQENFNESDQNGASDGEEQYYADVYNGEEAPVKEYADGNEADGDQAAELEQEEETDFENDEEGRADDGYIPNADEKKEMAADEGEGEEEEEEGEVEVMQMEEGEFGGRYNTTPESSLLVYNRIPKCASSTMQTILRRLSRHLGFEHISSLVYNQHQLNHGQQVELVENLTGALEAAPTHAISYDRHLYYTNFSALGAASPVYVNIVRDPVERFISSFYYRRSQERLSRIQQHGQAATPSPKWINRTVEQCVVAGDSECAFQPGDEKEMIITYFCGHHDFCRIVGHKDALQVAKQVVSQDYSVVGLVEHMEISLLLMETLLPRFMIGASQVYSSIKQKEQMMVNKNDEKPEVPEAIREKLLQRMADDFDFYNFLEQRLYQQRKTFLPYQKNV